MPFALAQQRSPAYLSGPAFGGYGMVEMLEVSRFVKNQLGLQARMIKASDALYYALKLEGLSTVAALAGKKSDAKKLKEEAAQLRALAPAGSSPSGSSQPGRAQPGGYAPDASYDRPPDPPEVPVLAPDIAADIDSGGGMGITGWVIAAVVLAGAAGASYVGAKKFGYLKNPRKRRKSKKRKR